VKVDNEAIWQEWVKEGKVKGFSIEGYFADKMKKNQDEEMLSELVQQIVDLKFFEALKKELDSLED
jgi:hypothetical protein